MPRRLCIGTESVDNPFDGAVGITQQAIARDDVFTYTVRFRDAGIYWYHPHHREDIQQDLGLYGNMLVRSYVRSITGQRIAKRR